MRWDIGLLRSCHVLFFFFKQKTAYEIDMWLEFRRVLFRSSYVLVAGGYSLALLTLTFWAVEEKEWRTRWTWIWIVFGSNAIAAYMFSELLPGVLHNVRSEERRVGKECKSRWSPNH